jgi:hypothetical protein
MFENAKPIAIFGLVFRMSFRGSRRGCSIETWFDKPRAFGLDETLLFKSGLRLQASELWNIGLALPLGGILHSMVYRFR